MGSQVMGNHLIIGLGGTGGRILRSFRKTIFQEFREPSPSNLHVEYLYVDSSREMMRSDDPTWKILGNSVQLGEKQSGAHNRRGLEVDSRKHRLVS